MEGGRSCQQQKILNLVHDRMEVFYVKLPSKSGVSFNVETIRVEALDESSVQPVDNEKVVT